MERIYDITFLITSFWMKDSLIVMQGGKIRGKREKYKGRRRRSRRGKNLNHGNSQSSLFWKKKILLYAYQENNDKKHDKSHYQSAHF